MEKRQQRPQSNRTNRARTLRQNSTYPEQLLWVRLRAGRLAGLKFRRQYPVGPFVADFYCHEMRLIIELDGNSHAGHATYDRDRTEYIEKYSIRVIRFGNDDVLNDLDAVLTSILLACGVNPDKPAR